MCQTVCLSKCRLVLYGHVPQVGTSTSILRICTPNQQFRSREAKLWQRKHVVCVVEQVVGHNDAQRPGTHVAGSDGLLPGELWARKVCWDLPGRVRHSGGDMEPRDEVRIRKLDKLVNTKKQQFIHFNGDRSKTAKMIKEDITHHKCQCDAE